jgi:hypothetical protein
LWLDHVSEIHFALTPRNVSPESLQLREEKKS